MGVQYMQRTTCRPQELDRVMETFKRGLKREVYGDFMRLLDKMEIALYEEDREAALSVLREIQEEVR